MVDIQPRWVHHQLLLSGAEAIRATLDQRTFRIVPEQVDVYTSPPTFEGSPRARRTIVMGSQLTAVGNPGQKKRTISYTDDWVQSQMPTLPTRSAPHWVQVIHDDPDAMLVPD